MNHHRRLSIMTILLVLIAASGALAGDPAALAAESAEYCNSTAGDAMTKPDVVITKVEQACALLEAEGTAAFPKFQGQGSEFLFEGTYIWIHSLADGTMLMHPMKYKLNGKSVLGLKDKKGKRLFATMNKVVKDNGAGWVEYYWPKPGSKDATHKVSYVRGCTTPDGQEIVVGCGLYRFDDATLAGLQIN